jgi:hypothetical protein
MRIAEMDNKLPERDRLKQEADAARASFIELSDVVKKIQKEIDDRTAAQEEKDKNDRSKSANAGK